MDASNCAHEQGYGQNGVICRVTLHADKVIRNQSQIVAAVIGGPMLGVGIDSVFHSILEVNTTKLRVLVALPSGVF